MRSSRVLAAAYKRAVTGVTDTITSHDERGRRKKKQFLTYTLKYCDI